MDFTEVGLLGEGKIGQKWVEIVAMEEGQAEDLVEGPRGGEGDEKEADGPERDEVLQMVGYARFQPKVEDEAEREDGEEGEAGEERERGYVEGRIGD